MKVLVIAASKHGSTMGIAETIGETLMEEGLEATVTRSSRSARSMSTTPSCWEARSTAAGE